MRVGERVRFVAAWSSFYGMTGAIVQMQPHIMILIDRDKHPIRVGEREIAVDEPSSQSLTGAE